MKIALITSTYFPELGGVQTYTWELAKALKKNYKVTLFAPLLDGTKRYEIKEGIEIKRLCKKDKKFYFKMIPTLIKDFKENKYDVIHSQLAFPAGFWGLILKKMFKLPLIINIHGVDVQKDKSIKYGHRLNPFFNMLIKMTLKQSKAIIPSEAILEDTIEAGAGETYIIPYGIDINRFKIKKKRPEEIKKKDKVILCVSRIHPKKNLPFLIKSMKNVVEKVKNARLILICTGNRKPLDELVKNLNLTEHITILQGVNPVQYYLNADVFVIPSLIENFPIVILEAMCAGLPIVTTECGACYSMVKNNGIITSNIDDAMIKLLNNHKLAKKMGKESYRLVKQFSWDNIVKKINYLYKKKREHMGLLDSIKTWVSMIFLWLFIIMVKRDE